MATSIPTTPRIDITEGTVQGKSTELRSSLRLVQPQPVVVILYGYGAELGDLKVFANSLKKELSPKYNDGKNIFIEYKKNRNEFFDYLESLDSEKFLIAELHIICHAFGAGLALGYHLTEEGNKRIDAINNMAKVVQKVENGNQCTQKVMSYEDVVQAEPCLLTDHLVLDNEPIKASQKKIIPKFTKDAFIKIWGCNSGVEKWIYTDDTADPHFCFPSIIYWEALNTKNVPKPSIAQAIANFFQLNTYGATSGSNVIVKEVETIKKNGKNITTEKWISSETYKKKHKHWPGPTVTQKLNPDNGQGYKLFKPEM